MVHPPAKGRNAARHPFFTATLDSIPAQQYAATRIPQHPLGGGFWGVGASAEKFRSKWFGGGGSAHLYGKVSALAAWLEVRPKTQPDLWRPRTPFAPPPPPVLSHVLTNTLRSGPRRRRRAWGTWPPNLSPRFPARPLTPRFADLDQVAVRVANVGADLTAMVFRLREELRTPGRPFLVDPGNVRDPDVQECARPGGIRWRRQRDGGLVVCGTATDVEDEPAVSDLHDDRVALLEDLAAEQRPIELTGSVLIGHHEKVGEHEALTRCWKVVWGHWTPPLAAD